jgi:hypothetical protein
MLRATGQKRVAASAIAATVHRRIAVPVRQRLPPQRSVAARARVDPAGRGTFTV